MIQCRNGVDYGTVQLQLARRRPLPNRAGGGRETGAIAFAGSVGIASRLIIIDGEPIITCA